MYAVALERTEYLEPLDDDSLADFIKSLRPEEAKELWTTLVQLHPRLTDL